MLKKIFCLIILIVLLKNIDAQKYFLTLHSGYGKSKIRSKDYFFKYIYIPEYNYELGVKLNYQFPSQWTAGIGFAYQKRNYHLQLPYFSDQYHYLSLDLSTSYSFFSYFGIETGLNNSLSYRGLKKTNDFTESKLHPLITESIFLRPYIHIKNIQLGISVWTDISSFYTTNGSTITPQGHTIKYIIPNYGIGMMAFLSYQFNLKKSSENAEK